MSILIFAAVDGECCLAPIRADTCGLQLLVGLDRCLDQPTQQVALVTLLECPVFIIVEHVAGHGRAAVVVAGIDHDVRAWDAQRGGNQVAILVGRMLTIIEISTPRCARSSASITTFVSPSLSTSAVAVRSLSMACIGSAEQADAGLAGADRWIDDAPGCAGIERLGHSFLATSLWTICGEAGRGPRRGGTDRRRGRRGHSGRAQTASRRARARRMGRPKRLVDADVRGGSWPKGTRRPALRVRLMSSMTSCARSRSGTYEAAVIGTEPGQPHLRGASHPRARGFATPEISCEVIAPALAHRPRHRG